MSWFKRKKKWGHCKNWESTKYSIKKGKIKNLKHTEKTSSCNTSKPKIYSLRTYRGCSLKLITTHVAWIQVLVLPNFAGSSFSLELIFKKERSHSLVLSNITEYRNSSDVKIDHNAGGNKDLTSVPTTLLCKAFCSSGKLLYWNDTCLF